MFMLYYIILMLRLCVGVVLSHTIPVIYERYEDQIDSYTKLAMDQAHKHSQTVNEIVAKKFSKPGLKQKKSQ